MTKIFIFCSWDTCSHFPLEAADTKTGREWCWYKGDPEVTRTENGELLSSIGVPIVATVVEVKTLIRMDTKK